MNLDSIRLYDIGTDVKGYDAETLQAIEWPINAWECLIPDNAAPSDINILLKLILNIVDQKLYTTTASLTRFLTESLQLNNELVSNVLADCQSQFFDNRYKEELHLTENAVKMLKSANGNISPDMEMTTTHHKVYLLQDCITKVVFPCFNINSLPKAYESIYKTKKAITFEYDFTNDRQPSTEALNTALRLWGKMQTNTDSESYESESINIQAGNDEKIETMYDADQKERKDISAITIISDIPKHLYLRAFVRFDYDEPEELAIHSPLGKPYDTWFRKLLMKVIDTHSEIKTEMDDFIKTRNIYFQDKIALGEDRKYTLLNEFPAFYNHPEIEQLKKDTKTLYQDHFNIQSKTGNFVDFRTHLRENIEKTLKAFKLLIPDSTQYTAKSFSEYERILNEYFNDSQYKDALKDKYIKSVIYDNYYHNALQKAKGNPKDLIPHLLIYGKMKGYAPVNNFFKENQELLIKIHDYANDGNIKLHELKFTPEKTREMAEKEFKEFEDFFRSLYTCFEKVIKL